MNPTKRQIGRSYLREMKKNCKILYEFEIFLAGKAQFTLAEVEQHSCVLKGSIVHYIYGDNVFGFDERRFQTTYAK